MSKVSVDGFIDPVDESIVSRQIQIATDTVNRVEVIKKINLMLLIGGKV